MKIWPENLPAYVAVLPLQIAQLVKSLGIADLLVKADNLQLRGRGFKSCCCILDGMCKTKNGQMGHTKSPKHIKKER